LLLSVPAINTGEGTFGQSAYSAETTYQVRSPVKRGDQMLASVRPALIKIDVEGFECHALAGLAETIRKHRPIIVTEVVAAHLARCGDSVEKLESLMRSFGYQGKRIGLEKRPEYTWQLAPFDAANPAFDALWFHPDNLGGHADVLNNHGLRT
jgi:hypothetical protein